MAITKLSDLFKSKIQASAKSVQTSSASTNPTQTNNTNCSSNSNNSNSSAQAASIMNKYENKFDYSNDNKKKSKDYNKVAKKLGVKLNSYEQNGFRLMVNKSSARGELKYDMNGDGTMESVDTASAIANSFDSVLDLYIQREVENCIKKFGKSTGSNGFLSEKALEYLKTEKHIVVNDVQCTAAKMKGKVWSFSLVDDEGNIMQDENGKLGSCIFADGLNADGYLEKAEIQFSNVLDELGYDCISRADFKGTDKEYDQMLKEIEAGINSGLYQGSDKNIKCIYGTEVITRGSKGNGNGNADGEASDADVLSASAKQEEYARIYAAKLQSEIASYQTKNSKNELSANELASIKCSVKSYMYSNYDGVTADILNQADKAAKVDVKIVNKSQDTQTIAAQTQQTANTSNEPLREKELLVA